MMIDSPGVFKIGPEDYHLDPAPVSSLNSGTIKILASQTPLHAWTASRRLNPNWKPPKPKRHFDIGAAAHALLLGRGSDLACIVADNYNTKAAQSKRDEARANGKTPLLETEYSETLAMVSVARAKLHDLGIALDLTRSELSVFAEIDGVWCRALIDNAPEWPDQPLYDYKTQIDVNPDACRRAVEQNGYDIQWRHYREVWQAATGEWRDFKFIFQEKTPPYSLQVHRLNDRPGDGDFAGHAQMVCAEARATWKVCLETGIWPDYPPREGTLFSSRGHAERREDRHVSPELLQRATAWQAPTDIEEEDIE